MIDLQKNRWFTGFLTLSMLWVGMVSFLPIAHAEPEHNTLIVGLFYLVREPIDFAVGMITDTFCAIAQGS